MIQNKKHIDHRLLWISIAVLIFLLDQFSKWWMCEHLSLYHEVPVLPFFSLYLAHNTGAAFSFLSQAPGWQRWFFVGIAFVIGAMIILWMCRLQKQQWLTALALALILGGALGNVWDRLTLGYVIDFLLLHWEQYQWPVFNIADSSICVGAVILFFRLLRSK